MKIVLFIIAATFMSASTHSLGTNAVEIIYCKKMGDFSGQVSAFEGFCPLGWYPA